ncbi:NAD(P)-binding protein [Setomelanomma holmii]|uniref:NAD(P)-binding protein n=1 Tax=Setomelanomma holmii TaxID=210430 RepID=A0A9P4H5E4_9PLEO|nr:NAD(P)-binding protein [Setomelanomma holmii]
MDPNAFTTPFQLTKSMRRDIYPAIDPKNPDLNAAGKVVLITGATGGIGGEVARAWATADAKGIIIVGGRNKHLLDEPANAVKAISPSTKVLALTADLTSQTAVATLFAEAIKAFSTVDVVVHAAASAESGTTGDMAPDEWFRGFEINVKGSYSIAHEYLKVVENGTLIFLGTLGASLTVPGMSSYSASKLAVMKLAEFLDAEKTNLRVFTIHPGIVQQTETGRGAVVDALTPFAHDKGIQTGGLSLYLAQPKADYLRGGFVAVNWDVAELEVHKEEIVEKKLLKLAFLNAKLGPEGHPWL